MNHMSGLQILESRIINILCRLALRWYDCACGLLWRHLGSSDCLLFDGPHSYLAYESLGLDYRYYPCCCYRHKTSCGAFVHVYHARDARHHFQPKILLRPSANYEAPCHYVVLYHLWRHDHDLNYFLDFDFSNFARLFYPQFWNHNYYNPAKFSLQSDRYCDILEQEITHMLMCHASESTFKLKTHSLHHIVLADKAWRGQISTTCAPLCFELPLSSSYVHQMIIMLLVLACKYVQESMKFLGSITWQEKRLLELISPLQFPQYRWGRSILWHLCFC